MRYKGFMRCTLAVAMLIAFVTSARADPPDDAVAMAPEAALACAAGRYRGEALAMRDRDDGLVQELRWRTPSGNVLRLRLTGPGCRFLEVDGVGQSDARILPGSAR